MTLAAVDIAIIGAGPYGLSLAAHLRKCNRSLRIFGFPMRFWSHHMPRGMCLKSEGFASSLSEPEGRFTLQAYCAEQGIPYADVGLPVRIETFVAYALEFQRRFVPELEEQEVTSLARGPRGFALTLASGEVVAARQVVVATGIMNFANLPEAVAGLADELVTHSSRHNDLSKFKGRHVAVLGAGSSAVDTAALLHQGGAQVELLSRRAALVFHDAPVEPRPIIERLKAPRSGLGVGWRSRLCTDIPLVFHAMPESFRLRVVKRHLGPSSSWFVRDMVEGKVRTHLAATLSSAVAEGQKVRLTYSQPEAQNKQLEVDHVIAGTGYKVALSRLKFLDETLRANIDTVVDSPILGHHFDSSVPGLYFIGAAAANSFGPLLRFAYGASYAAKRVARRLVHS